MTSRQLGTFIPTITVSESEVSFYVVYKNQATQPAAPKPSTSTTAGASASAPVSKPATKDAAKKITVSQLEKVRKRSPSPKQAPAVAGKDSEKVTSSGQPMDMSPSSASEVKEFHCMLGYKMAALKTVVCISVTILILANILKKV